MKDYIQLYTIWVHGRCIKDQGQQYPIDTSLENHADWHSDFNKAVTDYNNIKPLEEESVNAEGFFKDFIVILFVIDIDIKKFEEYSEAPFDLKSRVTQENLPYFVDYSFNTVAERIINF